MTYILPKRRTLVHKAVEPRKLSAKVLAAVEAQENKIYEVKYDGCHCILVKHGGKAYAFSRQGEPVLAAMDHVIRDLERIEADNFVLFAEAWHEYLDHSTINGTFRRSYVADGSVLLEAVIFDYVPLADFDKGSCPVRYKTRLDTAFLIVHQLHNLYDNHEESPVRLTYGAYSTELCQDLIDCSREKYGAVFATDGFIQKDRNGLWKAGSGACGAVVKIKDHLSIDVKVLEVHEGKGKFVGMVGALTVQWGLRTVTVGGGKLTDGERLEYWTHPDRLVGKIVEVHALGESAHGDLREGRFIRIRHDKTEGE